MAPPAFPERGTITTLSRAVKNDSLLEISQKYLSVAKKQKSVFLTPPQKIPLSKVMFGYCPVGSAI